MSDRPNILIVMTDHQRMDTVQPDHPCITPNTSEFLKQSVNFTKTYCPTAHCCPARATFFSGLYPTRHGVWNNVNNSYAINRGPHEHIRLFSQDLADSGYELAYAGKWHVSAFASQGPGAYGWRELESYEDHVQDPFEKWERIRATAADDPDNPDAKIQMPGFNSHDLYGIHEEGGKGDEGAMERGLNALSELSQGADPWALFIGWNEPHAPYKIPQRYVDMYDLDDIQLPPSYSDEMTDKPDYYQKLRRQVFDQLGEERTREAIRHFWAMCTHIDEMFGRVLRALDDTGQADNTIVLFCADHGDYAGDHGLFHKQVPSFLGAYNVPAIVRWPKGVESPGRDVDALVSLADFAPTFLEAAGLAPDRYFTGRSLMPFLRNERPADWRREICMQCEGTEQLFTQRQVLTYTHKYVYNGFGRDELYDLTKDPHEIVNVAEDPAYTAIKRDLVARMWRFAYLEQDRLGETQYLMVNTAPWGPKEGFKSAEGRSLPTAIPLGEENNPELVRVFRNGG